ncbi:MAG: hypothetical protein VKL39_09845 [Leptolyngbyaceae bacterium]|nr:hypothetical protein [Leptolyngbyaceae bacterium]
MPGTSMQKKSRVKGRSLRTDQIGTISKSIGIKKIITQIYSSKKISREQQVYLMSSLLSNEAKVQAYKCSINRILEAVHTGQLIRVD